MKTFWSFATKYKFIIVIALLFMFIELLCEIIQPLIMSKIVDDGIIAGDLSRILLWGSTLVLTSILIFVVGVVGSFYSGYASQHIGYDIRQAVFEKIQSFTYSVFSRFSESSLITRLTNDVSQVQHMVFMGTRIALKAPFLILGNLVMAFFINPLLALCLCVALPFIVGFLYYAFKRNFALFRMVQARLDRVNKAIQQSLMSIRLIRVFVRADYEREKFEKDSAELRDRTISTLRLIEFTTPIVMLIINLTILMVIYIGHQSMMLSGQTSIGDIVAVMSYATRMTGALSMLSIILMSASRVVASMERIEEVLLTHNSNEDVSHVSQSKLKGKISFQSVAFTYEGTATPAIEQISFQTQSGEMIAIMGATGSGKTTILQLLPRLFSQTEGRIIVDNNPIEAIPLTTLRQSIGYVSQDIMLFTGSIAENIRWGRREATDAEVIEAAKRAQIHDTIISFPEGYNTIVGQKGINLSGGQKQRLTIARALVRKPSILLLDDCTSALDVQTENALLAEIRALSCTVLLVTQKMSSTILADRIIIVDDGKLVATGSHDELLAQSYLYQRIYNSQDYARRSSQWQSQHVTVTQ